MKFYHFSAIVLLDMEAAPHQINSQIESHFNISLALLVMIPSSLSTRDFTFLSSVLEVMIVTNTESLEMSRRLGGVLDCL